MWVGFLFGEGEKQPKASFEVGNEYSSSIKGLEFLDLLSDYKLFKRISTP
jgi:hypothetical protein